jgi:GNAT superfamily N-acetyltransferase
VRLGTVEDGPGIGEVHAASWEAAYESFLDPEFLRRAVMGRREGWRFAISHVLSRSHLVLVAGYNDRVLAFSDSGLNDEHTAEVFGFYGHPEGWGSGLAALLMEETCAVLSTVASRVVLWTPDQAHRARHFYERMGFALTGRTRTEELSDWGADPTFAPVATVEYERDLGPPLPA